MDEEEDGSVYYAENQTINQTRMFNAIDSTMMIPNANNDDENSNNNDSQTQNNFTTDVSMDPLPIRPQTRASPHGMTNNITQSIVIEVSRHASQLCETQNEMTTTRIRKGVDATYTLVEKTINEPTGIIGNRSDEEEEEEEANEQPTGTYLVTTNDKNRVKQNETLTKANVK